MDDNEFPMTQSIGLGWRTLQANFAFFVGFILIVFGIQAALSWLPQIAFGDNLFAEFLVGIVSTFVGGVIEMGIIVITLKFYDGYRAELGDLFSQIDRIFVYIIASIVYGVMVLIGLVFLIVPGVYIALRFQFYGFFIVEEGCGPIDAISRSGDITKGNVMNLFFWLLLNIGLNILGLLALGVGILITCPITMLATAVVYRHLRPATGTAEAGEPPMSPVQA